MPQPDSGDNCCDCPSRTSPCDDCTPTLCPCDPDTPFAVMQKDFVEWFDPDTQPAWPNTWDANDAFSDDIQTDDGGSGCIPFEHHRVRVRFVLTNAPAPSSCTLRWNILNVKFSNDFSFTFTNNIQETAVHVGDTILGPFEIASPGLSGCGTSFLSYYNYPSGGSGGCCLDGTFCALYFTAADCSNRAGTFEGNCTSACTGCGFSAPP